MIGRRLLREVGLLLGTATAAGFWVVPVRAQVPTDVLDLAIAGSNDHVYAWYRDGTVSSGTSQRLDAHRTPHRYTLPSGKKTADVVGIGIAGNDRVYAWYRDGTVSSGTSDDLDKHRQPYAYALPDGKKSDQIVAIAIAGSNDHVYAWYEDGTVSSGTSDDLDRYRSPYSFSLPPGRSPADVLGIGITGSNDRVYAWYRDGTVSAGTSDDLDRHSPPYPFQQHLLIASWWGPRTRIRVPGAGAATDSLARDDGIHLDIGQAPGRGLTGSGSGPPDVDPTTIGGIPSLSEGLAADQSPPPLSSPFTPEVQGVDPMVAVGRNFVLVSQQGDVGFLDRSGGQLPPKNGVDWYVTGNELFGSFLDPGAVTDINRYTGFPKPCDDPSYPDTAYGRRFCVAQTYDLRVMFDAEENRFVVYGALRNPLWTDVFRKSVEPGEDCGLYKGPGSNNVSIQWTNNRGNWCTLARRHVVLAVSKTEDPRDGFYLYAITENNYRDYPWATMNGDSLVIAHRGDEMPAGPVATVLSLAALRAGEQRPPYCRYYKADVLGHERVLLPVHHGSPDGLTLMIAGQGGGSQIRVFGFPPPSAPYAKPALTSTVVAVKPMFPAVYRNGFLHFAQHHDTGLSPNDTRRLNIQVVRFPIWTEGAGPGLTLKASLSPGKGFRNKSFGKSGPGDTPGDIVSYEEPGLAVNRHGDMLIAYGRTPVQTQATLFPEVRYTVWYHDETTQRRSNVFKKGEATQSQSPSERLDYTTAVVDPMDDETIWIAHEYGAAGGYKLVVGAVKP